MGHREIGGEREGDRERKGRGAESERDTQTDRQTERKGGGAESERETHTDRQTDTERERDR